jgi:hypothetical protein
LRATKNFKLRVKLKRIITLINDKKNQKNENQIKKNIYHKLGLNCEIEIKQ